MSGRRSLSIPVPGGDLAVELNGPDPDRADTVVILLHGFAANGVAWRLVTSRLPDGVLSIAPDLRGRGASAALPGPYGMAAHADDVVAVLDALGVRRATFVGHSAGAFVATTAAERHPDRVTGLVLVDGGVPFDAPADIEAALEHVVGEELDRLRRRFASLDDALASWRSHPAFAAVGRWNEVVEAHALHDLGGSPPVLGSRADEGAVRFDATELLTDPGVAGAVERLRVPAELLRVDRGPFDDPVPLVPATSAFAVEARVASLRVVTVPGLNHHTIVLHPQGADAVAASIRRVLAFTPG